MINPFVLEVGDELAGRAIYHTSKARAFCYEQFEGICHGLGDGRMRKTLQM